MENYYKRELEKLSHFYEADDSDAEGLFFHDQNHDHQENLPFATKDILKGFARLSASLQEQLHDKDHFLKAVAKQIAPDAELPVPCLTLLEVDPVNLQRVKLLAKGSVIESGAVSLPDGSSQICSFTTLHQINVAPIRLGTAQLLAPSDYRSYFAHSDLNPSLARIIQLDFSTLTASLSELRLPDLHFHFTGKYADASNLYYLFQYYLESIELITEGPDPSVLSLQKKDLCFPDLHHIIRFNKPALNESFTLDALREYFLFPQALLYCRLDLSSWMQQSGQSFSLRFIFRECPFELTEQILRQIKIHCVPAVNLFPREAKPVAIVNPFADIPIGFRQKINEAVDLYRITSIKGISGAGGNKTRYFQNITSKVMHPDQQNPTYHLKVREHIKNRHRSYYVHLAYTDLLDIIEKETLSVGLECTNQHLPEEMNPEEMNKQGPGFLQNMIFKNLTRPTRYKPSNIQDAEMTILTRVQLNQSLLTKLEGLTYLLKYYAAYADQKNLVERKIQGISSLHLVKEDKVFRGSLVKGNLIEIGVRGSHFESEGDIFLFGSILNSIYANRATFNTFSQMIMTDVETGRSLTWLPEFNQESIS